MDPSTAPKDTPEEDINAIEASEVADKSDKDELPSRHRAMTKNKSIDTSKTSTKHHDGWRNISLIFFCFVASFLGAWVFLSSGLVNTSQVVTQNNQTIVSKEGELIAGVAERVSPSVVSIVTESITTQGGLQGIQSGAGTGMVISRDGYIMTNKHVIGEGTTSVTVVMSDGTVFSDVKVIGRDPLNDIAFLKIDGVDDLTPVELGDSSDLQVGQKVIAIGNALGQYQTTVTSGIISGLSRPLTATDQSGGSVEQLENLLQTDAAINPGNSGGPLLSLDGKVVGINTAIAQDAEGVGFAIPINDAKGLVESVLETGEVARAYLGVRYLSITPSVKTTYELPVDQGAYLPEGGDGSVLNGSPAAKAGLEAGDIITKVNDKSVTAQQPLSSLMSGFQVGETITLTILRDGEVQTLRVTLDKLNN